MFYFTGVQQSWSVSHAFKNILNFESYKKYFTDILKILSNFSIPYLLLEFQYLHLATFSMTTKSENTSNLPGYLILF